MGIKWYFKFSLIFLCFHPTLSQSLDGNTINDFKRITVNFRGMAFPSFNDDSQLAPDNIFDFSDETQMVGMNVGINYNVYNGISVGLGSGIEFFYNPYFRYVPIFMRIALNGGSNKNSIHTEGMLGGHFTNNKKMGILTRFCFGYRFKVFGGIFADISMLYTFQNLYYSFENSTRTSDYYNFESVGLSIGIDIN